MSIRVLAITSEVPWPLDTGGHIRSYHMLGALARAGCAVTVIAPTATADDAARERLAAGGIQLQPVVVGPRTAAGELGKVASARLVGEPYLFYRRHRWPAVATTVDEAIAAGDLDLLYFDHLDSFTYARHDRPMPATVLDMHNVYSTLLSRAADSAAAPWRRLAYRSEAARLRRIEQRAVATADLTFAVSDDDGRVFADLGARRVLTIANGVDAAPLSGLPSGRDVAAVPVLLFVGALSWPPNEAACAVLAREILPAVRARFPGAEAHLVGRAPSAGVQALAGDPGVKLFADVPDVRPHLAAASALVVPLSVGGGTRLKILEAFAAGLPVISTPVGAEGIDGRPDVHLLVADVPDMAAAICRLLSDPRLGRTLATEARRLATSRYDWGIVGQRAADAAIDLVRRRTSRPE